MPISTLLRKLQKISPEKVKSQTLMKSHNKGFYSKDLILEVLIIRNDKKIVQRL